jgi:hypothetical protein
VSGIGRRIVQHENRIYILQLFVSIIANIIV